MNNNPDLSIILPVFNEKESISIMINILEFNIDFNHEIIMVYDNDDDNTIDEINKLQLKFSNIHLIKNEKIGAKNAFLTGLKHSKSDIILLTAVDEIFPITSYKKMFDLIKYQNYDLISGTRYSNGGKRYGGSLIGHFLSYLANKIIFYCTKFPLSDATTGIKMFKKEIMNNIILESKNIGWAFAFELSLKSYKNKNKISEIPLKSVDRLFGGSSSFKVGSWIIEYLKWFFWSFKNL